jgi:hypothetical protein
MTNGSHNRLANRSRTLNIGGSDTTGSTSAMATENATIKKGNNQYH